MRSGAAIGFGDPRSEKGLEGCSSLLHMRNCRQKMFMVMASHAQRAGKGPRAPRFAVAGLLASQYAWEGFGATCGTWFSPDAELGDFLKSLESAGVAGICAVGDLSTSDPQPEHIDPRLICFEHCVLEAVRRLAPAPAGETVCFVMDWHEHLASSALWHLEDLMNLTPPAVRLRLGTLGFEHSGAFQPLQAAQLLARRCVDMIPSAGLHVALQGFHSLLWTLPGGPSPARLAKPVQTS